MTVRTLSAVQKVDDAHVEDASKTATDSSEQELVVREFDPKFMRKTTLKVCWLCRLTLLICVLRADFDAAGLDRHASLDPDLSCLFS